MVNAATVEGGTNSDTVRWTAAQLASLARDAGFSDSESLIAASIALAESGGNANAHNSKPPDDSYGLWQINMRGNLGPDRRKKFGIADNTALYDPATNAKAAHIVYKSQGWGAWTTYKGSKQTGFLDQIKNAVKGVGTIAGWIATAGNRVGIKGASAAASKVDQYTGISSAISDIGKNLFKSLETTGAILIALVFLVLGVILLSRKSVISTAGSVVKAVVK